MTQTISVRLPAETLERFRHSARSARKTLAEFLADRLVEAAPPPVEDLPRDLRQELHALERLGDRALWRVAQSRLPAARQRRYSRLLRKNVSGPLRDREQLELDVLGNEARQLTLKKAHAYLILKWRGRTIPSRDDLETPA